MKLTLALFAVLALIGLGQAHKLPNFGKGALHEDIQDILDLVPMEEIATVFVEYLGEDVEFQNVIQYLEDNNVPKHLVIEIEAIPEVINFLNFMQKEDVDIYFVVNMINKALDIKKLIPPSSYVYSAKPMKRTGGVAGFFKDVKILFNYDDFIRIYVEKMQSSPAFVRYVQELKSDNFQQVVNKVYSSKSFQIILNGLKKYGVNVQIVADIMFIVLGITVPKHPLPADLGRSLADELGDFVKLIPLNKFIEITTEYVTKDQKVQQAFAYVLKSEFHDLLREVEALKEHQELIMFLEKSDLHVIKAIQEFHRAIGMEKYMPPELEDVFKSQVGVQKVGDGLKAMLDDLVAVVPTDKIRALYDEKMKTINAFSTFVKKVTSAEMKKLVFNLYSHPIYQKMLTKCLEQGLDLKALSEFYKKLIPIPIPTPV